MDFGKQMTQLNRIRYNLFKEQNLESGLFDVIFEVEGKVLYSHKTILNSVSQTFASMLSDRWMKKDEPIKIKNYSYNNFYQFLTFLYTANCELTNENISSIIDIAEFYGVELFKNYCDEYLSKMEIAAENIFNFIELTIKYSMVQLKASAYGYITQNFQSFVDSDGFLGLEKSFIEGFFTFGMDKLKPDDLFHAVYKWAEKQSMNKQVSNPNINLNDQIKIEMSDFLPRFRFDKMELKFLLEFVLQRGFIFTSFNQLSKTLCDRILPHKIKVTNSLGQTLQGDLKCDYAFIQAIKDLKTADSFLGEKKANWWKCKEIVSNQSSFKKRDGVEWYLIYHFGMFSQYIGYAHRTLNHPNDYVLAELTTETSDFIATHDSNIEID